ncbi:basic amino acid/polyamine antiporter [Aerococcus kribbianus]|uniref:Basic amino acid/polyamine antiporter n=1 Tax=Aerococcus kribbianus TaxID=2999064 RepID=A0A9X3FXG9_9LACT|nr:MULTISPECIES: basic amino acid/polyamine antiporter [unclassified Aerococcus]MCZ0718109.1 basic amino acid/polyamine antiporter [Aerococcus sp. YH-aer221]MCZ0726322.1 basic amino acid/polyamine antiporter [Aerococcus sp. YH-aer222]
MSNNSGQNKVGLVGLTALTVSSVLGGGIFNLMSDMAQISAAGPSTIALLISGIGMATFVFCLQNLTFQYPELDAGIYSFPDKAFGRFVGFISAVGFWFSIFLGNVALGTLAMSSLAYFFPIFGDGQNIYAVICASVLLWLMHYVITKGSDFASKINNFITVAKLIPVAIFIITIILAFDFGVFTTDFWGAASQGFNVSEVAPQLKGSLIATVWVFVGVDGAVTYSGRAKSKSVVRQATILSFLILTSVYLLATVLSYGILTQPELASLEKPAMAGVLESVVGSWGAILINLGVIISAIGTWFACTMFAGEILYQGTKDSIFPKFLAKENKYGAPVNALLVSDILVQIFFFSLLINASAYNFTAILASSTMLVTYLFISMAQVKLPGEVSQGKNITLGIVSSLYMVFAIWASGMDYILLTSLLFAPFIALYVVAQREAGNKKVFTKPEWIGVIILILLAFLSIFAIFTGTIDITQM